MLTVRDALNLPALTRAQLVAGRAGLSRQIQWVQTVDDANARYDWQRPGVLLLTTGAGLRQKPELQSTLIRTLDQQNFCGLVISTGHYFERIPPTLTEQADALSFPLIETPPDLLFIQIAEGILPRLVNQQYDLQQRSAQFNQQLTNLVLQGAGLSELIQTLSVLLHRSVVLESPQFQILAAAQQGEVDEARAHCVKTGQTKPELVEQLSKLNIYARLQQTLKPLWIEPMPALGMSMSRIVTPIVVQREVHGYIWIVADQTPLTPLDEVALNHGAMVAALMLFKDRAVQQAAIALQGDFFARLLAGEADSAALREIAKQIDYRLECAHQVWMIRGQAMTAVNHMPLEESIRQWLAQAQPQPFLLFPRDGVAARPENHYWVAVVECQTTEQGHDQATAMASALASGAPVLIGLGDVSSPALSPVSSTTGQTVTLQRSYEQAQEAMQIAVALGQRQGTRPFYTLGVLHWLYQLSSEDRAANFYLHYLDTIRTYDLKRSGDLLLTLESYLDSGSSIGETAAALHIHRNTLLHRLERIESLCQVNLKDAMTRLNFYVAIKSDRLHQNQNY
ncbi:MAG: PucR family transcriptional regulator ligand-binding domain-containing protein [Cyanobacteria bacterium P01_D01_bin.1]